MADRRGDSLPVQLPLEAAPYGTGYVFPFLPAIVVSGVPCGYLTDMLCLLVSDGCRRGDSTPTSRA